MSENENGWYVDPSGRHRLRYWNGTQWTDQVNDGNINFADPMAQDEAFVPPAPGTKPVTAVQQQPQQPNVTVQTSQPHTSTVGILVAGLVVVVLVIALLIVLNDDDDSSSNNNTPSGGGETPTTQTTSAPSTEAPATTAAPEGG